MIGDTTVTSSVLRNVHMRPKLVAVLFKDGMLSKVIL